MIASLAPTENSVHRLLVSCHGIPCGYLTQTSKTEYSFTYLEEYKGPPISLTMPVRFEPYTFDRFPPFFDGLLPEGVQLEALIRQNKIDAHNYMAQLEAVGGDLVGAVTVMRDKHNNANKRGDL
jgi:serine/threonine-protein kinase HipA